MAVNYFDINESEQREILQSAAVESGRRAEVLEKDVWICWTLNILFSIPGHHPMAFKGGTSLSKVYGVIDRFSEDVDITLDYRKFGESFDPFSSEATRSQISKFSDRLKDKVRVYANETVFPYLQSAIAKHPQNSQIELSIDSTGEKILLSYPSVVENKDPYLKSSVLIELGGRNVIDPNETHTVSPYLKEFTHDVEYPEADVVVLSPQRTFWEKATLIHVECNRDGFKPDSSRLSRHWYDLVMLSEHDSGKTAMKSRELLEDVIKYKKIFFNSSYANYDACLDNQIRLMPQNTDSKTGLEQDYLEMIRAGMMYEDAPHFSEIMAKVEMIENQINASQQD